MTDLVITAANVVPGANARFENGFAGETITAGQAVYKAADGKWYKADSNSATALARVATAIASNGASANQPITVQKSGKITIGGTLTASLAYYLSDTAGGICLIADVGSGEYSEVIGMATSTTELDLVLKSSGAAT